MRSSSLLRLWVCQDLRFVVNVIPGYMQGSFGYLIDRGGTLEMPYTGLLSRIPEVSLLCTLNRANEVQADKKKKYHTICHHVCG